MKAGMWGRTEAIEAVMAELRKGTPETEIIAKFSVYYTHARIMEYIDIAKKALEVEGHGETAEK